MMIGVVRTPEVRFENLPGFPYKPNYIENLNGYNQLRMHYVDEGSNGSNKTYLCLHGQPTWSYLYRKMIPVFLEDNGRVIVPDFFGFGRSDKPVDDEIYTFDFHRNFLIEFIKRLDLTNITLVCQDWGGILGLTLPMEMPEKFSRLILMNTAIATGDYKISAGFQAFRDWVNKTPDIEVGRLMKRAVSILTREEAAAYDAPFPDATYKAGVRRFPNLVATDFDDLGAEIGRQARDWFKNQWNGQAFMAIGMQDPVLGSPIMKILHKMIPGCSKPMRLREAGHFTQEWGEKIALSAIDYFKLGG
ncbi:MAG: alpha/beta fold hydrolase [Candidatus Lokiarchaeota archaeon]|nr:alpha/beta fold hydrolase [Candidatus Lokiarchaeota archaeon]